jgi:hypothetical protein
MPDLSKCRICGDFIGGNYLDLEEDEGGRPWRLGMDGEEEHN